ncbi:creatininase family protein [Neptunomonas phycophila]|uniref:creatininase family protein n=1 Tax=Neptunomonas phycophila TaxID=1572645 RepID=UPI001BE723E0|nr:creatininase family protein [Neptunomonas phycophila]MBT3145199.1 creatininase family protein [Neptunomonas phycophila]MDO6784852.1 creatininase family protein [Neptunomonas phycophila]
MYNLHQMTWEEVANAVQSGIDTAVLPIGATEQHGPHMGCGMDTSIAHTLCSDAATQSPIILLPTLPYGCSIGHSKRWPGTMALSPKTLIDVLCDLGDWVQSAGIRRLIFVNGHVTNEAPLRCALEMLRAKHDGFMVAIVHTARVSERVQKAHFNDAEDWHANDAETALMMALHPDMVRDDKLTAADDPDRTDGCIFSHPVNRTSTNGVTGQPSAATKAKGAQLYEWMLADLTELLHTAAKEEAPLNQSYHQSVLSGE